MKVKCLLDLVDQVINLLSPYPNKKAAIAANGGAYPPDLSLIIKARPNGAKLFTCFVKWI